MNTKRHLIIGLGTGRSGTTSLAHLLHTQPSSFVVHEGSLSRTVNGKKESYNQLLPWKKDPSLLDGFLKELEQQAGDAHFYGSVGFYFLPYVEDILERHPDTKFIVLARRREEVVRSFSLHSGECNWWMDHQGKGFTLDPMWDVAFPKFKASTKEEAIAQYWDLYWKRSLELERKYPQSLRIFEVSSLNTTDGIHRILDFAGYPNHDRFIEVIHDHSVYAPLRILKRWGRYLKLDTVYRFFKGKTAATATAHR